MSYKEEFNKWLIAVDDIDKKILQSMSEEEKQSSFECDIDFGTGGIRQLMGLGTNRLNKYTVCKVSLGISHYLNSKKDNNSVVICFDNRANSKEFCEVAAKTFAANDITVYMFDSLRTTPQLSFYTQYLKCDVGIMITASHNPKEYNGYKVYNRFGGQLINSDAKIVKSYIDKVENYLNFDFNFDPKLIHILDENIDKEYYKEVLKTSILSHNFENIKVIYSSSHGTGLAPIKYVLEYKKANLILVKEQCYPSKTFENTKSPNPEDKASYQLGLKYFIENKADILIVTDPDCDRIGCCILDKNNNPYYINGNQMGLLLTNYILSNTKKKNNRSSVVSTLVSSCLIEKLVKSYVFNYVSCFTGFKNIGEQIIKNEIDFIFGFEESYGYLKNPCVKDKDAVQGALLICEMASFYKSINKTLFDVLNEINDKFGEAEESQYNIKLVGQDAKDRKEAIMNRAYSFNLSSLGSYKIKEILNFNIGLNITKNTKIPTGDNLVKIVFEDDSFIAIRPSGTEPKVKIYFSLIKDKKDCYKTDKIKYEFINFLYDFKGTSLFLDNILVERIWGGNYFKNTLKKTDSDTKYGELWSVSGLLNNSSKIINKDNILLSDYYSNHKELFDNAKEEIFPILIKIINANDNLSVQVHPDDEYAKTVENCSGKTEGWLIMNKEDNSNLIIGHNASSFSQFKDMVENKQYSKLLKKIDVEEGDFYPIPSGTIHAINKGITLLEIQQSCDITYRFYDYDRKDSSGKTRPLHIQKALDVVKIEPYNETIKNCYKLDGNNLWDNKYFSVDYYNISSPIIITNQSFLCGSVKNGYIIYDNKVLNIGDSFIACSDKKYLLIGGKGEIVITNYKK